MVAKRTGGINRPDAPKMKILSGSLSLDSVLSPVGDGIVAGILRSHKSQVKWQKSFAFAPLDLMGDGASLRAGDVCGVERLVWGLPRQILE
jgi:hypothetical protein